MQPAAPGASPPRPELPALWLPAPLQDVLWWTLHKFGEPLLLGSRLRKAALKECMKHIHYEVGWSVGWMSDWLVDLVGWLAGCLVGWLLAWLVESGKAACS